jgi:hypothetical protein
MLLLSFFLPSIVAIIMMILLYAKGLTPFRRDRRYAVNLSDQPDDLDAVIK